MINTTEEPIALFTGVELHNLIQHSISKSIELLELQLNSRSSLNRKEFAFFRLFGTHNQVPKINFDENFLLSCFHISQSDSQNTRNKDSRKNLSNYFIESNVPGNWIQYIKRGIKLMFVELWRNKAVLLPTVFTLAPNFHWEMFEHRLLKWLKSFNPLSHEEEMNPTDSRRLYYYGPRLILTTDWQDFEDISIIDITDLQRASRLYQNQKSSVIIAGGSQIPFSLLPAQALKQFPLEVKFNQNDLEKQSLWVHSGNYDSIPFENFLEKNKSTSKKYIKKENIRKENIKKTPPALVSSKDSFDHECLRKNFISLQKGHRNMANWLDCDNLIYYGREHVDLTKITKKWIEALRAYMHQRTHIKGYRSHGEAMSALNILTDYLFYYLPWWYELAKNPKVPPPSSPKEFNRYSFVCRHATESIDEFPETLLNVISWRRSSNESIAIAITQLSLFFNFLEKNFCEDESIAGFYYRSPLDKKLDAPKASKRSKTNKIIIPKNAYSYLIFYCYALEEASMEIEKLACDGKIKINPKSLRESTFLDLKKLGIDNISVKYRSNSIPLSEIPNVFQWQQRELKDSSAINKSVFIPHCTALRLLLTSVETGLRCQSVQWLDKFSWCRELSNVSSDSYTFPLYVNTDKTKTEPWSTPIVYRVKDLLLRELQFQDIFIDANAFAPVFYEGVQDTPFPPISPLFRSINSGKPISDQTYSDKWQRLMVGFEEFYRNATGETHAEFYTLKAVLSPNKEPIIRESSSGLLYCPLSLLAIHTPHACRASFATNRSGILSLSDTAELLGHSSEIVTAHYTKPSFEDISERLKDSDIAQNKDFLQFENNSEAHVRADRPESTLVRSFSKNRSTAISDFKFAPSIRLWSTEESLGPDEGLQLLRDGPMSRIKFRETHICPVGEECPADIIEHIGAPRRCGCCPLAMRCIDHLTAIAAKRNQLLERIRYLHRRYKILETQHEPMTVLDEIWNDLELDANEYLGWQLTEELLTNSLKDSQVQQKKDFLVEQPDVVRRHLMKVSRSSNTANLMLQRIADSNAYPSMATPSVELAARQIKRRLLAGKGPDVIACEDDMHSAIADAAQMLAVMMKATGLNLEQVSRTIAHPTEILLTGGPDGQ